MRKVFRLEKADIEKDYEGQARAWIEEQKRLVRQKLKGNITQIAVRSGLRVTDIYNVLLRLAPLYPRSARRFCVAFNSLQIYGSTLHWIDLVNPINAIHPIFAPLHPIAVREERKREEAAIRGGARL